VTSWPLPLVRARGQAAAGSLDRGERARSVRNELERARLRHAYRLAADPAASRSRDDLMRLEPLDILASPVFSLSAIDG
jgi:hypothetical protein